VLIGIDASRITRRHRTGTENYSLHVIRHLLGMPSAESYRLYLSEALPASLLPSLPNVSTRLIRLPRLWTQIGLSREMLRAAPDVLFVPSHVLPLITAPRNVVVVYDVGHRFFPRAHTVPEWLYVEWAIRRHVRIATHLLTISEASKRDLVRLYGADPTHVAVAYPAVEERFRPASDAEVQRVRARYGLGPRYVLHLGTVKPRKNLPRLIHAFARAGLPPDTQLALAGMTTFGGKAVERAVEQTGVAERIRRLAYVPDADLPALYTGAACVAIVSLYEGFGMPALEALACGAPVLASNRGSLPEIVDSAGVIVNPLDVDAIAHGLSVILTNSACAATLRAAGPSRARRFTWSDAARVTLDVLRAAGTAPRSGPPSAAR
jgi:glycosyltransferase involved in cell wall biosynthesis